MNHPKRIIIPLILLLATKSAFAQFTLYNNMPLPAYGIWDSSNQEIVELECINFSNLKSQLRVKIFDAAAKLIADQFLEIQALGESSLVLNQFGIAGEFGSFELSAETLQASINSSDSTNCYIFQRRFSEVESVREFEYLSHKKVSQTLLGVSSGIFNTKNQIDASAKATQNFLKVANLGSTNFNARVLLYDEDGKKIEKNYDIKRLAPGHTKRIDLGRNQGRKLGLYRIIPYRDDIPYVAEVSRLGFLSKDKFNFSLIERSEIGNCSPRILSLKTSADKKEILELSNISSKNTSFDLNILDLKDVILHSERITLSGFSSRIVELNSLIGNGLEVLVQITCVGKNIEQRRKIVARHVSYLLESISQASSANSIQLRSAYDGFPKQLNFPLNTENDANNILRITNKGELSAKIDISLYAENGVRVQNIFNSIEVEKDLNLALQKIIGDNFKGTLILSAKDFETSFDAIIDRQYLNKENQTEVINQTFVNSF